MNRKRFTTCCALAFVLLLSGASNASNLMYVRGASFYTQFDDLLISKGHTITYSDVIPQANELALFDGIIVNSYPACNTTTASYLADYLWNGGGVTLISGTPWALSGSNINLAPISSWFGADAYWNSGGLAFYVDNPAPFDPGLTNGDVLLDVTGSGSDAAILGVHDPTHIVGRWGDGQTFSFWNTYGAGRMFYNAGMLSGRNDANNGELLAAGIAWTAGSPDPVPEPATGLIVLTGAALAAFRARKNHQ